MEEITFYVSDDTARSLNVLAESFVAAASRNPALNCDVIETLSLYAVTIDGLEQKEWEAFIEVNSENTDAWQLWGPTDVGTSLLRLYGNPEGLADYKRLSEQVCALITTYDPRYAGEGWESWTYLMRTIAQGYATVGLSFREYLWDSDTDDLYDDDLRQIWGETKSGIEYPLHPLVQRFDLDLFMSSAAALRLLAEPEGYETIDIDNADPSCWNPFVQICQKNEPSNLSKADIPNPPLHPKYVFELKGKQYFIRYTEGEVVEERHFQANTNLNSIFMLLQNPHKQLSPFAVLGLPEPDLISESSIKEELNFAGMDDQELSKTIQNLDLLIQNLASQSETEEQTKQLQFELDSATQERDSRRGNTQKTRRAKEDPLTKPMKVVDKHRERARELLSKSGMPLFAKHLKSRIMRQSGTYSYNPDIDMEWEII